MRIVLFWADYLHYHAARVQAANRLAEQDGHEIFPIAIRSGSSMYSGAGYQHLVSKPVSILVENQQNGSMQSHEAAKKLLTVLNKISPDAIAVVGYDSRVAMAALGWCRRHHRGAVLMSESQSIDFPRNSVREFLKRKIVSLFDSALVGGKPHVEYATALGMPSERIFAGYDVVDNEFWSEWSARVRQSPASWRRLLGLPEHFFLTACRLIPKKNVAGLLRSYAHYLQQVESPWPLVVVGDGPLRAELEGLAQSLHVANQVRFMGYLSADEMGPVYALASVFILASAYSEQWGLVVNEAMAAGLPVLVSRICGCVPDLVIDGVTGYSFDPADEFALAHLLVQCSNNAFDLDQLGNAAWDHIKAYSPRLFAQNLIASAEAAINHARERRIDGWPLPLVLP